MGRSSSRKRTKVNAPQRKGSARRQQPRGATQERRKSDIRSQDKNDNAKRGNNADRVDIHERGYKRFINWWMKPAGALIIGLTGIVLGVAFWWWPHSSPTPPFKSTSGGENPTNYFKGTSSANIAATQLILFSKLSASNNAAVSTDQLDGKVYCRHSNAIAIAGVYACIPVTPMGNAVTVTDPCFAVSTHDVICSEQYGSFEENRVSVPNSLRVYHADLSAIGGRYPWRLSLANGMTCVWDWWERRNNSPWLCGKSNGGSFVLLQPAINGDLVPTGDNPLKFNSVVSMSSKTGLYYADNLIQGQQSTWTVLLENEMNPGDYQHVDVTKAWY